jgi:hypothetical protein
MPSAPTEAVLDVNLIIAATFAEVATQLVVRGMFGRRMERSGLQGVPNWEV